MANMDHNHPKFPFPKIVRRFMDMEASGGIVMIAAAIIAMFAANSGFYHYYKDFLNTPITFGFSDSIAREPIKNLVKDVLLVLFFFIIGLELKREMAEGVLSRKDQILLPLLAATGGMAMPAIIFIIINFSTPQNWAGWAIPSATDIAFALGILMLAGRRVPPALKIFLLAIAIFDDLGAIIIIALFYSGSINVMALVMAALGILILAAFNRLKVSLITPYLIIGIYLWFCIHHSGIHATVAGVITGLFLPMRSSHNNEHSPVNQTIHFLHPWVSFLILPVFAFTSAGVSLRDVSAYDILEPLPIGIMLSLFIGKQIGIFGATWLSVKKGIAAMPENTTWLYIYGVSVIAGIGFTMSLFIGILAFPEELQSEVKMGVIFGSLLSTIWGAIIFRIAGNKSETHLIQEKTSGK